MRPFSGWGYNMKTLKDLVQDVERAQNGCNLSGILHSAAAAIIELRAVMPSASTTTINNHPIMRAWSSKIADLSGNYDGAYPLEALRAILSAPDSDLDVKRSTAAAVNLFGEGIGEH